MLGAQWLLEGVLVVLLGATLFHALRLERALGVLKRDRAVLEELVEGFNESSRQAETGVERLRSAADGAGRQMARQIEIGQRLRDDLSFLSERSDKLAERLEAAVRAARMVADGQGQPASFGQLPQAEPDRRHAPPWQAEFARPAEQAERTRPAEQAERARPAEQAERTRPAGQADRARFAEQAERASPAEQVERVRPGEQVDRMRFGEPVRAPLPTLLAARKQPAALPPPAHLQPVAVPAERIQDSEPRLRSQAERDLLRALRGVR
jgi:hypothetical protein